MSKDSKTHSPTAHRMLDARENLFFDQYFNKELRFYDEVAAELKQKRKEAREAAQEVKHRIPTSSSSSKPTSRPLSRAAAADDTASGRSSRQSERSHQSRRSHQSERPHSRVSASKEELEKLRKENEALRLKMQRLMIQLPLESVTAEMHSRAILTQRAKSGSESARSNFSRKYVLEREFYQENGSAALLTPDL